MQSQYGSLSLSLSVTSWLSKHSNKQSYLQFLQTGKIIKMYMYKLELQATEEIVRKHPSIMPPSCKRD